MNLNWSARQVQDTLSGHWVEWIPYFALIALVMLSGWYQVRQTQARQLRQGGAPPNAQMQMITKIMPVFFGFITYTLNAATTLYFVVSNLWRIGQQHLVLNKMYEEAVASGEIKPGDGKAAAGKAPPGDKGSGNGAKPAGSKPAAGGTKNAPAQPRDGSASNGGAKSSPSPAARRRKKRKR
jgi:membrane protein insertase Oxa1/YidC/SpoIIIJ